MSKQVKDGAGRMTGQKAFSVIMALVFVITMVGMAGCGKTTTSTPPANQPADANGQVIEIDGGFYKLSKDGSGYTATLVGTNASANAAKTAYTDVNVNGNANSVSGDVVATFATYTTTATSTTSASEPTFELLGSFNIGPGSGWYYIPDGHVTIEVGTGDGTPTPATPDTPPADVTTVPVVGIIDEPDDEFDFDGTDGVLVPGLPDDAVIDAPVEVITDIDEAIDEIIANLPEDSDPAVVEDNFKDWLGPVCPPTIGETINNHFGGGGSGGGTADFQTGDGVWSGLNGWTIEKSAPLSAGREYTLTIHPGGGVVDKDTWLGFVAAKDWDSVLGNTYDGWFDSGTRMTTTEYASGAGTAAGYVTDSVGHNINMMWPHATSTNATSNLP